MEILQSGMNKGLTSGSNSELTGTIRAQSLLRMGKMGRWVEILYFTGNLGCQAGWIKSGDLINATSSVNQAFPKGINRIAERRHCSHTCNDNS